MTHPFYTPEDAEYLDGTVPLAVRELQCAEPAPPFNHDMVDDVLDHLDMIELAIELDEARLRTYHMGVAL